MNKSDLISLLATGENLTEVQAARIVKLIFDGFTDALVKGDRIEIRGVGSFALREYKTYVGRNPKTGRKIEVKPKRSPCFKVGKELKEKVNGTTYRSGLEEVRPVR
jgi:integration host factor subunit beta